MTSGNTGSQKQNLKDRVELGAQKCLGINLFSQGTTCFMLQMKVNQKLGKKTMRMVTFAWPTQMFASEEAKSTSKLS